MYSGNSTTEPNIFSNSPGNPQNTQVYSTLDDFNIFSGAGSPAIPQNTQVSSSAVEFDIFEGTGAQQPRRVYTANTTTSVTSGYRTQTSGLYGVSGGQYYRNSSEGYGEPSYGTASNRSVSSQSGYGGPSYGSANTSSIASGSGYDVSHHVSSTTLVYPPVKQPEFNHIRSLYTPDRPPTASPATPRRYLPPQGVNKSPSWIVKMTPTHNPAGSNAGANSSGAVPPDDVVTRRIEKQEGFLCELTGEIMRNPVRVSDGHVYEQNALLEFVRTYHINPVSKEPMTDSGLQVDVGLQQRIQGLISLSLSIYLYLSLSLSIILFL